MAGAEGETCLRVATCGNVRRRAGRRASGKAGTRPRARATVASPLRDCSIAPVASACAQRQTYLEDFAEAKVDELDVGSFLVVAQHEVLELEVPVAHSPAVRATSTAHMVT